MERGNALPPCSASAAGQMSLNCLSPILATAGTLREAKGSQGGVDHGEPQTFTSRPGEACDVCIGATMRAIRKSTRRDRRVLLLCCMLMPLLVAIPEWVPRSADAQTPASGSETTGPLPTDLEAPPDIPFDDEVRSEESLAPQHRAQHGVRLVKRGAYAEAISLLEPYRETPDFSLLHALGIAYLRTQRNQEAYDVLIRAHALRPDEPGPMLPAALACARMAKTCDEYRRLALEYKERGGRFGRLADKIAEYQPVTLTLPKR
jgi:hypothetical protein